MSAVRAVTITGRLAELRNTLLRHRETIAMLAAEVDEALADLDHLAAPIASLESGAGDASEAADRAHLAACGELGAIVLRISEERRVPLRQLLGPGNCHFLDARRARMAAIKAMLAAHGNKSEAARVLRISPEAIRVQARRFRRKEAA